MGLERRKVKLQLKGVRSQMAKIRWKHAAVYSNEGVTTLFMRTMRDREKQGVIYLKGNLFVCSVSVYQLGKDNKLCMK